MNSEHVQDLKIFAGFAFKLRLRSNEFALAGQPFSNSLEVTVHPKETVYTFCLLYLTNYFLLL